MTQKRVYAILSLHVKTYRAVAQGFSVLVWGTRGRQFKSAQPDLIIYPARTYSLQDFFCIFVTKFVTTPLHSLEFLH